MAWIVVVNSFFAGLASVAVTGRITYALLRDKAFQFSKYMEGVHKTLRTLVKGLIMIFMFDIIILLMPVNNENGLIAQVFLLLCIFSFYCPILPSQQAILGLATVGFQVSYAIPIFLRLLPGNQLDILHSNPEAKKKLFTLGIISKPLGLLSVLWLSVTSVFLFLPTELPVTADNMNYTMLVVGLVFLIGAVYWIASGHINFRGPTRLNAVSMLSEDAKKNIEMVAAGSGENCDVELDAHCLTSAGSLAN